MTETISFRPLDSDVADMEIIREFLEKVLGHTPTNTLVLRYALGVTAKDIQKEENS